MFGVTRFRGVKGHLRVHALWTLILYTRRDPTCSLCLFERFAYVVTGGRRQQEGLFPSPDFCARLKIVQCGLCLVTT